MNEHVGTVFKNKCGGWSLVSYKVGPNDRYFHWGMGAPIGMVRTFGNPSYPLFSAISRGYNSNYNDRSGPTLYYMCWFSHVQLENWGDEQNQLVGKFGTNMFPLKRGSVFIPLPILTICAGPLQNILEKLLPFKWKRFSGSIYQRSSKIRSI